jgi:hypothetical protein
MVRDARAPFTAGRVDDLFCQSSRLFTELLKVFLEPRRVSAIDLREVRFEPEQKTGKHGIRVP